MHVIFVVSDFNNKNGGKSHAALAYIKCVSEKLSSVAVICTNLDPYFRSELIENAGVLGENLYELSLSDFLSIRNVLKFFKITRCENVKMHFHGVFDLLSNFLMLLCPCDFFISPHGMLNNYGMRDNKKKKLFYNFYLRHMIARSSGLIFTSSDEYEQTMSHVTQLKSTFVVPIPVFVRPSLEHADNSVSTTSHIIEDKQSQILHVGTIGRIHEVKNLENLLIAICRDQKFLLSVAGDGEVSYLLQLRYLADKLGIGDRVKWLGLVDETAKHEMLSNLDLYVQVSWSESFGLAAVEAAAAGVPVLCSSRVAIARELFEMGACKICEPSSQSIYEALLGFSNLKALGSLSTFSAPAEVREHFSSAAIGDSLKYVYELPRV